MKKKVIKKKRKTKRFRLNFFNRQLGMIEEYKPVPYHLVKYYLNQVEEHFRHTPYRVKIYLEDTAGYTVEQILPIVAKLPQNPRVKFIWGRRKAGWEKNIKVKLKGQSR